MYFDTFTNLLVIDKSEDDLYQRHATGEKSLAEITEGIFLDENLSRKSSLDGVLSSGSFPLSDTTLKSEPLLAWRAECIRRVSEPGFSFSRPWIFKASSEEKLIEETLALFPFRTQSKVQPVFISEEQVQDTLSFETFLVNSGVIAVRQKAVRGPRYKPFDSKLFTVGGTCQIWNSYLQKIDTVSRCYVMIGITTEDLPSAIPLAEVLAS